MNQCIIIPNVTLLLSPISGEGEILYRQIKLGLYYKFFGIVLVTVAMRGRMDI